MRLYGNSIAAACIAAVIVGGMAYAVSINGPPGRQKSDAGRQVMGGIETRLDRGDSTPLVSDRAGDVDLVGEGIDGVPLALSDGRVAIFMTRGVRGSQYLMARYSTDNGHTWGETRKLFDFPAGSGSFSNAPALLSRSGTIHIFGKEEVRSWDFNNPGNSECYLWHVRSLDGGKTWSKVTRVDFGLRYTGAVNGAFQMRSGRIICPVSGWTTRKIGPWVCVAPYSDDDGATWHKPKQWITMNTGAVDWYESGAIEPVGVGLKDGRAWILPRSEDGYQWESYSLDGITWSPARHTRFVNNQSAMAVMRLKDGRLILFWNNCGPEGVLGIYAERLVMCAAISSDEGKTWHGYREIGRRTTPGEISYPFITQMRDGYALLWSDGNLWRVRPDFLLDRNMNENFSAGTRRWSTLAAKGAFAAPDPNGGNGRVLSLLKPDPGTPSAACMNFPYGVRGEMTIRVRIEPGFQGSHFTLSDHYDLPRLYRDGSFPFAINAKGRVMILGAGGAWLDTPGDLTVGKWQELNLRWNCKQGCAALSLDGIEIGRMEQFVRAPGVCYLRLRSTAPTTDTAGLYIRSVRIRTAD